MRSDMHKVIVERPRTRAGHGVFIRRALRRHARRDPEGAPAYRGMRRPYQWGYDRYAKSLNENLRPLERFLQSRAGRPWNDVYSEICRHIRLTNAVQRHILIHLKHMVADDLRKEDAEAILLQGSVYIDAETGVLCCVARRNGGS